MLGPRPPRKRLPNRLPNYQKKWKIREIQIFTILGHVLSSFGVDPPVNRRVNQPVNRAANRARPGYRPVDRVVNRPVSRRVNRAASGLLQFSESSNMCKFSASLKDEREGQPTGFTT